MTEEAPRNAPYLGRVRLIGGGRGALQGSALYYFNVSGASSLSYGEKQVASEPVFTLATMRM